MRWAMCVVLLSSPGLIAQSADPARLVQAQAQESARLAAEWLNSPDARVRAWGAHLAIRDQQTKLMPRLVALAGDYLTSHPSGPASRDDHESMLVVLDAIIQLDGRLPLRDAAALYPEFPAVSLIMLSHGEQEADQFLLEIFRTEQRALGAWQTAGNLLMNRKPVGLAGHILSGYNVDVRVRVVDATSTVPPASGSGLSCAYGGGGPRQGWPPIGNYYVSGRGTLLSQGGTASTFYQHIVGAAEPSGPGPDFICDFGRHATSSGAWNRSRAHLLARLVGESPDAPSVPSAVTDTLTWRDDARYLRDLRAMIRGQQTRLDELAARLVKAGVLTAEEQAVATSSLTVTITDARGTKRAGLPTATEVPGRVTFVQHPTEGP